MDEMLERTKKIDREIEQLISELPRYLVNSSHHENKEVAYVP